VFVAACGPLQAPFHKSGQISKKCSFWSQPLREKTVLENPQIFQNCKHKIFSAENIRVAARGGYV